MHEEKFQVVIIDAHDFILHLRLEQRELMHQMTDLVVVQSAQRRVQLGLNRGCAIAVEEVGNFSEVVSRSQHLFESWQVLVLLVILRLLVLFDLLFAELERAHLEVSVQDQIELSFIFVLTVILLDFITLLDDDLLRHHMDNLDGIDDRSYQALEFFLAFVDINALHVGIIDVDLVHGVHFAAVVVAHCKLQLGERRSPENFLLEDETVDYTFFRRWHCFLKVNELRLLGASAVNLQDVLSDLVCEMLWKAQVSHGRVGVVHASLELILPFISRDNQVEVDTE